MKHILSVSVIILLYITSLGQYQHLFYFDTTSGMFTPAYSLSIKASKFFWDEKYDSTLYYLDSIDKVKPYNDLDDALEINKMLAYAGLRKTTEFKKRVIKWVTSEDTNAVCTCLEQAPIFSFYTDQNWYKKLVQKCWKKKKNVSYSNIELSDKLAYLHVLDQNSCYCKNSYGVRCSEITDSLFEVNIRIMASLIDTLNLPSINEIGSIGISAICFSVLHADYDPKLQIRFAERMLLKPASYDPSWPAWIIDRALTYNGKSQLYGSFPFKLNPDEFEQVNKNRKEIGLDPISPK